MRQQVPLQPEFASERGAGQSTSHAHNTAGGLLMPQINLPAYPRFFQIFATGARLADAAAVPAVSGLARGVTALALPVALGISRGRWSAHAPDSAVRGTRAQCRRPRQVAARS